MTVCIDAQQQVLDPVSELLYDTFGQKPAIQVSLTGPKFVTIRLRTLRRPT